RLAGAAPGLAALVCNHGHRGGLANVRRAAPHHRAKPVAEAGDLLRGAGPALACARPYWPVPRARTAERPGESWPAPGQHVGGSATGHRGALLPPTAAGGHDGMEPRVFGPQ